MRYKEIRTSLLLAEGTRLPAVRCVLQNVEAITILVDIFKAS